MKRAKEPLAELIVQFAHKNPMRGEWLYGSDGDAYIRVTQRIIDGKRVDTLDIANIIIRSKLRGKGIFTALLLRVEHLRPVLYVESIQNERLEAFLYRQGFQRVPNLNPPCLYKCP